MTMMPVMGPQGDEGRGGPPGPTDLDEHQLAAARLWAVNRFPYLATALFASSVTASPGLGGDGVSVDESWRLYVDPQIAANWSVEEMGALLVHHTGHLVRDHAARAVAVGVCESTTERWSLAADAELNDDLEDAGLTMPGEPVLPEHLGHERGRLAEEYFQLTTKLRDPRSDTEEGGQSDEDGPPQAPDHGSGAHGQARSWEKPSDGSAEGNPAGLSNHEGSLLRAQVASEILNAVRSGDDNVPTNWRRWAESLLAPVVDWRKVLAGEVRRGVNSVAGCVDYSYRRPSRRAVASPDVVLPCLDKPVPEVVVVCDTSGSMSPGQLERVLTEVEGLLSSIGLRDRGVRVLAVDAAVQAARRVSSARQVELLGGGGTDMGSGIEAAAALRPRPSIVVVLTDGLTPWPRQAPRGIRVVVGLVATPLSRGGSLPPLPGWARVVRIEEEDAA